MKRLILILLTVLSLNSRAQTPQVRVLYVDSAQMNRVADFLLSQVGMTGKYPDLLNKPVVVTSITTTGTSGPATFNSSTGVLNIPSYISGTTYTAGSGIGVAVGVISNTSPDQTVSLTAGNNGTAISGTYPAFTITPYLPTFNTAVSRSLNSNYTVSSTRNSRVYYTIRIAYNVTVLLGSTGAVSLQYSTDTGSTWKTVSTISNSLNLGLALTGYNDFELSGDIPANALVRLNSTVTNATNTYQLGTEIY